MTEQLRKWILPVLAVAMGLQMLRLFIGSLTWYLRDTVGLSAISLAPYAILTFLVGFLAPLLWKIAGPRLALWIAAGGLSILRLAEQIVIDPGVDLLLSIAGVAAFVVYLPVFFGYLRSTVEFAGSRWALGLALGLAFDTALRGLFGTLDLTWIAGVVPLLITALMSALTLWAVWKEPAPEGTSDSAWRSSIPLIAIGPFMLLELLFFQSHGLLGEIGGLSPDLSFLLVMIGNLLLVIGMYSGFARTETYRTPLAIAAGAYLVLALATGERAGQAFLLTALVGQFVLGWGLSLVATRASVAQHAGLWRTGSLLPLGTLLFLLLTFAFYLSLDIALPFSRSAIPLTAAALLGLMLVLASWGLTRPDSNVDASPVWAAGALVAIPLAVWVFAGASPAAGEAGKFPVRVMTFNIHSAFGSLGRHDPEAIAQVIEAGRADIVGLQEVSRHRLLDGETDLATWLSRRLDMPIVFAGTEEPHWGNAILSRFPISDWGSGTLPRDGALLGRGYTWVKIDIGSGVPLLVIDTHLHQLEPDHDIRQIQVAALLEFWAARPNTILLGDLNADPGSAEMMLLSDGGLRDSWSEAGAGEGLTSQPTDLRRRIDWIWHSADLAANEAEVLQTLASDHLPLVVQIQAAP